MPGPSTRWFAAGIVCLAAVGAVVCSRTPAAPPNIVLVLIDTLRWDRLGAYGNPDGLTPFLDSLAARSTVFRRAYAQSSWTNPSVASLLTSRYQSQHGVISFGSHLADDEVTLPEVLHAHGYATAGFTANFLVEPRFGFGQGFDQYATYSKPPTGGKGQGLNAYEKAPAERLNREALAWLDARAAPASARPPVFLYVHYMEPHPPYAPDAAAVRRAVGEGPAPDAAKVNEAMGVWPLIEWDKDPALVQSVKDLYDAEIAALDVQLRALFGELERRGVLDGAIVVVTADHGEEFLEHGLMGHHNTLYEEVVRVPLFIHIPGQTERVDVDAPVSLVDVAPTLLDLIGVPPPASFMGRSLAAALGREGAGGRLAGLLARWTKQEPPPPVAYSELIRDPGAERYSQHERAVVAGTGKLIAGVEGEREFFDLAADPAERNPQALGEPERARLDAALEPLRAFAAKDGAPKQPRELDADTKERMRALGYAE